MKIPESPSIVDLGRIDTAAATGAVSDAKSAMAYQKQLVVNTETMAHHSKLFTGDVYYVDAAMADNTEDGHTPDKAKKTIGAAIGVASAGDAIVVKAGTYTETGLDMNLASLELWCEIGAIISPATGTGLIVSAGFCKIRGQLLIIPSGGNTGLYISAAGTYGVYEDITVSAGDLNFEIAGVGGIFRRCIGAPPTVVAFDITANSQTLIDCTTAGTGATYGYRISNGADYGVLKDCSSLGHTTSGYAIEAGSSGWTIKDCCSGAGDGRWVDADDANVWSGFTYDDEVFKEIDFTDASTTFNLFLVTGAVDVESLFSHVVETLNAELGNCKLELAAGGNTTNITTTASLNSVPAKSFIGKTAGAGTALTVGTSASPQVIENVNFRDPRAASILVAEDGADTYIRLLSDDSSGTKDGKMHWHCKWTPISDDGFVTAA